MLVAAATAAATAVSAGAAAPVKLTYDTPAGDWMTEALPERLYRGDVLWDADGGYDPVYGGEPLGGWPGDGNDDE